MDRTEFKMWLAANESRFQREGYTIEQIADAALAAGAEGRMIAEWVIRSKFQAAA